MFDSNFQEVMVFRGYMQNISNLKQMKARNMLIAIGTDDEELVPVLKIWDQDRGGKRKRIRKILKSKFTLILIFFFIHERQKHAFAVQINKNHKRLQTYRIDCKYIQCNGRFKSNCCWIDGWISISH